MTEGDLLEQDVIVLTCSLWSYSDMVLALISNDDDDDVGVVVLWC